MKKNTTINISDVSSFEGKSVEIKGWIANKRSAKGLIFVVLRDGSGFMQCVINEEKVGVFEEAKKLTLESALKLEGTNGWSVRRRMERHSSYDRHGCSM